MDFVAVRISNKSTATIYTRLSIFLYLYSGVAVTPTIVQSVKVKRPTTGRPARTKRSDRNCVLLDVLKSRTVVTTRAIRLRGFHRQPDDCFVVPISIDQPETNGPSRPLRQYNYKPHRRSSLATSAFRTRRFVTTRAR